MNATLAEPGAAAPPPPILLDDRIAADRDGVLTRLHRTTQQVEPLDPNHKLASFNPKWHHTSLDQALIHLLRRDKFDRAVVGRPHLRGPYQLSEYQLLCATVGGQLHNFGQLPALLYPEVSPTLTAHAVSSARSTYMYRHLHGHRVLLEPKGDGIYFDGWRRWYDRQFYELSAEVQRSFVNVAGVRGESQQISLFQRLTIAAAGDTIEELVRHYRIPAVNASRLLTRLRNRTWQLLAAYLGVADQESASMRWHHRNVAQRHEQLLAELFTLRQPGYRTLVRLSEALSVPMQRLTPDGDRAMSDLLVPELFDEQDRHAAATLIKRYVTWALYLPVRVEEAVVRAGGPSLPETDLSFDEFEPIVNELLLEARG